MSSLLLILSTFFDENGGAGPTHKILSRCDLCPAQGLFDMVAGGWESRLPSRLPASVSKTPKWILSLSLMV